MAGSWNHTVTSEGKLFAPYDLLGMLETRSGDVFEYAEEAYGMVWYLATELAKERADRSGMGLTPAEYVELARASYLEGIEVSPGYAQKLEEGDE